MTEIVYDNQYQLFPKNINSESEHSSSSSNSSDSNKKSYKAEPHSPAKVSKNEISAAKMHIKKQMQKRKVASQIIPASSLNYFSSEKY